MSDLPVPRRMERLLESFGADTEFRDAVIGDLAEEFAIRAKEDGARAARRWYRREALRVAPYLVRDWWRGLQGRDAWYFARTITLSSVLLYVFERATRLVMYGIDPGLRSLWEAMSELGDAGLILYAALMLVWTLADGVFGGYVAARLGRRAPLTSALALAAAWMAIMVGVATQSTGILLMFRILNTITIATGIILGGVLGATRAAIPPTRASTG